MDSQRVFTGNFVFVDRVETERSRASEVVDTKAGQFSVSALVYAPEVGMVYFVSQDRCAMMTEQNPSGTILETVAGRCDVLGESAKKTIVREVEEEMGFTITEDQVEILNHNGSLAMSPGILRERMILAYVKLKESSVVQVGQAFGLVDEGEKTTVVGISVEDLETYTWADMKTFALVQWFLRRELQIVLNIAVGRIKANQFQGAKGVSDGTND